MQRKEAPEARWSQANSTVKQHIWVTQELGHMRWHGDEGEEVSGEEAKAEAKRS